MGSYEPTDYFKKCIENKEYGNVRRILGNLIFTDRSFSKNTFYDALNYVKNQMCEKIYEEYNNKGLISNRKSIFTEDDFEEAVAELSNNFCQDRILDVEKISKQVYGNKIGEDKMNNKNIKDNEQSIKNQLSQSDKDGKARGEIEKKNMAISKIILYLVALLIIVVIIITVINMMEQINVIEQIKNL